MACFRFSGCWEDILGADFTLTCSISRMQGGPLDGHVGLKRGEPEGISHNILYPLYHYIVIFKFPLVPINHQYYVYKMYNVGPPNGS